MTAIWGWAVYVLLVTRDWPTIRHAIRAHPLNAGGGYLLAGVACVITCPLWTLAL
jgi:hypothetical protein